MSKLINKYIIILIGFYVFWLGILPPLISNAIKIVCNNLSVNSEYKIEVVNPRIRTDVLPVIRIYADKFSVNSKSDVFKADISDFKIKFRLLPLLSGRLHLNTLRADKIYLSADLKSEIELDKEFFNKLGNTRVSCDSVKVTKFDTVLYQKDAKSPIIYSGEDLVFKNKNRYVEFKIKSNLKMDGKTSEANVDLFLPKNNDLDKTAFNIVVKNLDIAPFRVYFKHYLPKDLLMLNGTININADKNKLATEIKNCSVIMKDSAKSLIFPSILNIKADYKIKRQCISLEDVVIDAKNIHANINGKICDYLGKIMPTLDLNIRFDKSRVEDFVNMLPPFAVEDIDVYKLKKYKFYADAMGNISINGRLPEPDITGDIYINNGILIRPIPNASAGATVKIRLTGRYANFDVSVPAGGSEKVMVNGGVELYNIKYSDMRIKSTHNVRLLSAEDVVNPLHEILNFVIGPVPILHVPEGTGNIDITVKGNRKNPHVWGELNFYDATVFFKEIPDMVLKHTDAVLTFNDQNAVFTTSKGVANGKDLSIKGVCDLFGKFDFDAVSQNQPTALLYKSMTTATLIPDMQKMLPKLDKAEGLLDLSLKIYGSLKYIEDLKINENAFVKGLITIKNNNYVIQDINADNANGFIKFDADNAEVNMTAKVADAPMSIKASVKKNIADLVLNIPKINPNFVLENYELKSKQYLPFVSLFLKYKGDINNIEYDRVNLSAKILESNPKSDIKFLSGEIGALNGKITVKNFKGYIKEPYNIFSADLKIANAFTDKPLSNGNISLKTNDISILNEILNSGILPEKLLKYAKDFELKSGGINLNCKINDKLNAEANLHNIEFEYIPAELPIKIINGNMSIRNNNLKLSKINLLADKMPVLIDGEIKDIFTKQLFDLYVSTKPSQEFIDKFINKKQIYPVKIRGDIVCWTKIKGILNNFDIKMQLDMNKDSYFYYLGATIGDIENAISLYIDSKINNKLIKIKEFNYDKVINSLSGKQTRFNLLKVNGGVELLKDDVLFKNLYIKTYQPTDARIFNIIFRKPNIKQGQFTSDLKINNKLSNPRVIGSFKLFETNIPFIDVSVKNIELLFKDKTIDITSKGEVIGNEVKFEGIIQNKLTQPYHIEKANLYTKDFSLNRITAKLKTKDMDSRSDISQSDNLDLNMFTADNFKLTADKIELRNIAASDFAAELSLDNKGIFDVNRFEFNIAQGKLGGRYKYNLKNSDMSILLDAERIDANEITLALFDLKNQIYGDMTGTVKLSCNGSDFKSCMASLNGNTIFNVKNGRMPKLGSLEYLLKAGNLVKGGVTGLSINNVIDLITPLKTGEFSDIFGSITIKDGLANDIEITTKGKDLSLFISGTYNFATEHADMEVLGLLSRKISTMFGPVGNLSINTLFNVIPGVDLSKDSPLLDKINKIPGFELSSKAYRKFLAEIKGNINGDNYVTKFNWIN